MATIDPKVKVELVEDIEPAIKDGDQKSKDGLLVNASGDILRLPIPSADPNDPLNFTFLEKMGVIVSCCWFCESLHLGRRACHGEYQLILS